MSRTYRRKGLWYGKDDYRIYTDYYNWRWHKASFVKDFHNSHIRSHIKNDITNFYKTGELDDMSYSFYKKAYGFNTWRYL